MKRQQSITLQNAPVEIPKPLEQLSEKELERKVYIGKVMTYTLRNLTTQFVEHNFQWLLPVSLSPVTDPLWPDPGASIEKRVEVDIYGRTVRTTASMIIHKIIASSTAYPKLFILSPNVRIEKRERAYTGKHVYEFTQLDFEVRNATSNDIINFVSDLVCNLVASLKRDLKQELTYLGRYDTLKVPKKPFKICDKQELEKEYGVEWETCVAMANSDPVWITNIPREFYDFEDFQTGIWDNYDLFMPQYGEVLSGAKREWEYEKILKKIERDKINKDNYAPLLKLAKQGKIKPSAGAGIGIERIVGWLTGVAHIAETQPFPRVPGTVNDL
ncbi:MAG: asparagine synthetase A [Candidatus Bathyarchaeia archaeon]